jgi:hypothetical protein
MAGNSLLSNAKAGKNDEFYTQLADIEKEMRHYKIHFKDKTVFCNCDDPYESNFFKYFALNFNSLGLKKLIATCYATSPVAYTQISLFETETSEDSEMPQRKPYKIEITEVNDENHDGRTDLADVEYLLKNRQNVLTVLKSDGDFRSEECVELLKQADIVATNPPFSSFRPYLQELMKYEKEFIIIGNVNAITYKEMFPLIMNNKVWLGASIHSGDREFRVPDDYPLDAAGCRVDEEGNKYIRVKGVRWFTNIDYKERHENLTLYKTYNPDEYPKYETFDAIDVSITSDIPCDYFGVMGVPKTFMDKYNPDQFEILGYEREDENVKVGIVNMPEEFLQRYRAQGGTGHYTKGMKMLCLYDREGKAKIPFSRILIRRKQGTEHEN